MKVPRESRPQVPAGFGFTVLNGTETRIPVIPQSYHKINSGPFVRTPYVPHLLRPMELDRLRAFPLTTLDFQTGGESIGQGVQPRVVKGMLHQIGAALCTRTI